MRFLTDHSHAAYNAAKAVTAVLFRCTSICRKPPIARANADCCDGMLPPIRERSSLQPTLVKNDEMRDAFCTT